MSTLFTMKLSLMKLFFFCEFATSEIYTLSLHDALPILAGGARDHDGLRVDHLAHHAAGGVGRDNQDRIETELLRDRKSTRLNSSHRCISYAVFCLKKKKYTIYSQFYELL